MGTRNASLRRSRRRRRRKRLEEQYRDESPDRENWKTSFLNEEKLRQLSTKKHSKKTSSVPCWAFVLSNPTMRNNTKNELDTNTLEEENIGQLISNLIQRSVGEHFEPSCSGVISFIARLAYCRHEYIAGVYFPGQSSVSTPYRRTYE